MEHMDMQKMMILIRGEDKTEDIERINVKTETHKIEVTYAKGKSYEYNENNVVVLNDPKSVNMDGHAAYVDGMPLYKPQYILNFGKKYRVCGFNNEYRTIDTMSLSLIKNGVSAQKPKQILEYFREISKYLSDKSEGEGFLEREMEELTFIHPESVLGSYLSHQPIKERAMESDGLIFPFKFNLSQKLALEKALTHSVSVIEGPPGTGKTQTILNILSNLVANQKKSAAVVSNNNEAVKNVIEKMQKQEYGFLAALLGRKSNQEHFFANMPKPAVEEWNCEEEKEELIQEIQKLNQELNKLLEQEREKLKLKQELENLAFLEETSIAKEYEKSENLFYKLKLLFRYGIFDFKKLKQKEVSLLLLLQREFYRLQIEDMEKEIESLECQLKNHSFEELSVSHQQYSERLFRKCLYESHSRITGLDFTMKNFKGLYQEFLKAYPIILSTTFALRRSIPQNYLLDYVIIDESSQVDLITAVLVFSCCRNIIIVGDEKQLPQITDNKIEEKLKIAVPLEAYNYFHHSILTSMLSLYGEAVPCTTLREHYRCHPKIIEFCNQKYYAGRLIPYTDSLMSENPFILYKTSEGNHMRKVTCQNEKGTYNQRELDVIIEEVLNNPDLTDAGDDIGIVTPYRKQANKATALLKNGIQSDTVHKYQGREKDTMIMSTVLDCTRKGQQGVSFVDDPHMVNVAVSRAIKQFILVTDHELFLKKGKNIGDLIRYIQYNTLDKNNMQSGIVSIFDLLYQSYSVKLLPLKEKMNSKARWKSEESLKVLLDEILQQEQYHSYIYAHGILIRNLLSHTSLLNEEETEYVNHHASLDFVIFHRLDKSCALVIEVDGFTFHENKPNRMKKDALKDSILNKYDIPILRLPTNGSQERKKIENNLLALM